MLDWQPSLLSKNVYKMYSLSVHLANIALAFDVLASFNLAFPLPCFPFGFKLLGMGDYEIMAMLQCVANQKATFALAMFGNPVFYPNSGISNVMSGVVPVRGVKMQDVYCRFGCVCHW